MQMEDMDYLDRASNLTMSNLLCPDRSQVPAAGREDHIYMPLASASILICTPTARETLPASPDSQPFMLRCLASLWVTEAKASRGAVTKSWSDLLAEISKVLKHPLGAKRAEARLACGRANPELSCSFVV